MSDHTNKTSQTHDGTLTEYAESLCCQLPRGCSLTIKPMLITDFNLTLLTGGLTFCDSSWSSPLVHGSDCFKIYLLRDGGCEVTVSEETYSLQPGYGYLLNGRKLQSQTCRTSMTLDWVHFSPDSPYLEYLLQALPGVCATPLEEIGLTDKHTRTIADVFGPYGTPAEGLRNDAPAGQQCTVHALLIQLLGAVLTQSKQPEQLPAAALRLLPALEFMREHDKNNPSLAQIAATVHMAPNSFHRLFRQTFGSTPFEYVQRRRMNRARHLLHGSDKSINEIATEAGYGSPFYFSRAFRARFGTSPRAYRQQHSP